MKIIHCVSCKHAVEEVEELCKVLDILLTNPESLPPFSGERIGGGSSPQMEIAVDPLDGTTLISQVIFHTPSYSLAFIDAT